MLTLTSTSLSQAMSWTPQDLPDLRQPKRKLGAHLVGRQAEDADGPMTVGKPMEVSPLEAQLQALAQRPANHGVGMPPPVG